MKPKRDPEQSTSKIKAAALHLVATKGYSNTSLEEMANKAGAAKGAVYYHFKSKKRLIFEILDDIEMRLRLQSTAAAKMEKIVINRTYWPHIYAWLSPISRRPRHHRQVPHPTPPPGRCACWNW
jgi:AcrR family transcriptional regulator